MKSILYVLVLWICLLSCNSAGLHLSNHGEMEAYVKDPANGLVRVREVNGIRTTVSILPAELIEQRSIAASPDFASQRSAITSSSAKHQLTFLVNLAAVQPEHGDVMAKDIWNVAAYMERSHALNFELEQHVSLRCGTASFKAALSTLENTYGLETDRNIVMVFVPEECDDAAFYGSETLDLVINDQWFGTGTQHFVFDRTDLERFHLASTPNMKS